MQIALQGRQIPRPIEIVHHHETTAIDVFPEIPHFGLGQCQLSGFGHDRKRVVEDFRTSKLHDPVGHIRHINVGRFRNNLREMLVGAGVIVRPSRPAEFSPGRVLPARDDELRRRRLVLKKEASKTLGRDEGSACKGQHCEG